MKKYLKTIPFSMQEFVSNLKAGIQHTKYEVFKEEKDNKIFSSNFEELKRELLKYNIEFDRVPNKRVYFYLKLIERP